MLIVLSGFLGSGRKALAHQIAIRREYFHYDMDRFEVHMPSTNSNGEYVDRLMRARTDEQLYRIYEKVIAEIPAVARMYENVIITHTFHRRGPRTKLFEALKKHFDRIVFVWIDSKPGGAVFHLKKMEQMNLIRSAELAMRIREYEKSQFEPFEKQPLAHLHTGGLENSTARLWELAQKAETTVSIS